AGQSVILTHTANIGNPSDPITQTISPTTGLEGPFGPQLGSVVSFTVKPLVSTVYTMTATSISGSLASTFSVTVNPQPTVNPTYTNANCTNSINAFCLGLSFTPASPVPNYTVVWTAADGNSAPGFKATLNADSTCGTNSPPGVYLYTVVAEGGCGIAGSVSIS